MVRGGRRLCQKVYDVPVEESPRSAEVGEPVPEESGPWSAEVERRRGLVSLGGCEGERGRWGEVVVGRGWEVDCRVHDVSRRLLSCP